VQPIVVRVEDLIGDFSLLERDEEDGLLITFPTEPKELSIALRKLWGLVLLMAIRDRATSVHYHPWRGDSSLAEIVDNIRYEMVPPPPECAEELMSAARSIFLPTNTGFFARLLGRGPARTACATVSLDVGGVPILWDVVCWFSGERGGLDFFRVTLLEPPSPP
jgi:hypothetical protein